MGGGAEVETLIQFLSEILLVQFLSISSSSEGSNFRFLGRFRTGACVGVCCDACALLLALPGFVGFAIVMLGVGFVVDWDRLTVPTLLITDAGIYINKEKIFF